MKERINKVLSYESNKVSSDTFIDGEIKDKISEKDADAIRKILINTPLVENGGVTAITGFYYQFLVSLQYLTEMYEDKWDYIGIELHDDIVAVKDNKVRFIQVKTSKDEWVLPSKSGIYSRSKEEEMFIGNSWIDKLISKAKFFPKNENFEIEFNIVTSFKFQNTGDYKIPECLKKRDCKIDNENKIIKKLKEDTYLKEEDKYIKINYLNLYGETIEKLLMRLHIDEYVPLKYINCLEANICKELERVIFKENQGISVSYQHLKMLIGEICCRCNVNNQVIKLIINKEQLDELFEKVRQAALNDAENAIDEIGNIKFIDEIFSDIHKEAGKYNNYNEVKGEIVNYYEYIKKWVVSNGGITSLFNRYCDGASFSTAYSDCSKRDIQVKIKNLFFTIIFLNLVYTKKLQFDSGKALLIKKIVDSDKILNSFLSLKCNDEIDDGIDRLKRIIVDSELFEQLQLSTKRLNVIFSDYYDEEFDESKIVEIPDKIIPETKNTDKIFTDEPKMGETSIFANIVPGKKIMYKFRKRLNSKEKQNLLIELRKDLQKYGWKE